jgi:TonB family protein
MTQAFSISMIKARHSFTWALAGLGLWLTGQLTAQQQPVVPDFGPPLLRDWVQPEYPEPARKDKREGSVTVEFVVEQDGTVSRETVKKSTDEIFDAPALAAVRQWKFKPALENGEPAAGAMRVQVVFQQEQLRQKSVPIFPPERLMPVPLKETPATPRGSIEPDYPAELESSRIPGEVHMEFWVDAEGKVEQPRVLWATHPAFVETSLRTIERAVFIPAKQGPLAKRSVVRYPVGFESMGARPSDILAANGLTFAGATPAVLPRPLMLIRAVYSRERLLAGEEGKAVIEFTIDEEGRTREIAVISADYPEFGAALGSAAEAWVFKPAQGDSGPLAVRMQATQAFAIAEQPVEGRLAGLLRPDGAGVSAPTGLDRKLKPLWRGFPAYPQALREQAPAGEAQIEFVIDRDGRARVPRIVSATHEAFGWAAATAISQWVFERPTKGGEPVDVAVRIPVGFKPPEK